MIEDIKLILNELKQFKESMRSGFDSINKRFDSMDSRFDSMENKLDSIDEIVNKNGKALKEMIEDHARWEKDFEPIKQKLENRV